MDKDVIFNIANKVDYNDTALDIFRYQYRNNEVYRRFYDLLERTPILVKSVGGIPFLPISFFKTHTVVPTAHTPDRFLINTLLDAKMA